MITKAQSLKHYVLLLLLFLGTASVVTAQNHDLYGLWVKRAAFGSGGSASITTSTVDEQGNVYVAGTFTGELNFSDDFCTPVMRTAPLAVGHLFLIKYDSQGKYQWDVVVKNGSNTLQSGLISCLVYKNGKILLGTTLAYLVGTPLPLKSVYQNGTDSKTITGPSTVDGQSGYTPIYRQVSFQIINATSGALESSIGDISKGASFETGSALLAARIEGDDVFVIHFGYASIYPIGGVAVRYSVASSFKLADGSINYANRVYPNQPMSPHPGSCDGSRIEKYTVLANQSQILIHRAYDWSTVAPAFYLLKYNADFTINEKTLLLSVREVDDYNPPEISSDASNNVYVMMNFGDSKNDGVDIPNSNRLTNALGSTITFTTDPQANTIVLGRVDPNLAYTTGSSWVIQIGSRTLDGVVYGSSLKTVGNYTYITGRFKGSNVPFGGGKTLSSAGDYDGFYAVYDNNTGTCMYAARMGGSNSENNTTLNITPAGNMMIAGTYNSPLLQTDPSGRLYPISSNGTTSQGFVSLYSIDPASSPIGKASSFGDAPTSYGLAVHYVEPCLTLGAFDPVKIQSAPAQNLLANSALNDDALVETLGANGLVNLSGTNFKLTGNKLEVQVKTTNTTDEIPRVIAWIDFNQNGVFDVNEASEKVKAGPITTLTWTNALPMMKHGRTYLRIRLTTDDNIDGTQPSGMFFTGDVEDHLLYFNLYELEKSMKLKNRPIGAKAEIGDTIQYTLTLTNLLNQQADFKLFDPIPDSTRFTKASNSGTVSNVAMADKNLPSVVWNFVAPDLAAGASATRTFEVVVTGQPVVAPHTINNIAFAVRSTDTINSATATCQTWPVVVSSIKAVRDNVSLLSGQSINVPFLKNDIRGACANTPLTKVDTIKSTWGHIGSFVINKVVSPADTSLVYTPATGKFGIDSLTYYIKCGADSSANKVYLMVHKPLSLNYSACPGAAISIGFTPIAGVAYNWYSVPVGGTITNLGDNKNSIIVTQGSTVNPSDYDYGTWYVEPVYKGVKYPRIEVVLNKSESCGGNIPAECAKNGTVIFTENFGGTSLSDPKFRPTGLGSDCSFTYRPSGDLNTRETYILTSDRPSNNYLPWDKNRRFADHTPNYPLPETDTVGYYLMARYDGYLNDAPQQFYQKQLTDLCEGTKLYFSVWATNFNRQSFIDGSIDPDEGRPAAAPNLRFELLDLNGNVVAYYTSGKIINTNWAQYGFDFRVPAGLTSLKLRIINNVYTQDGLEMGLALDDIEVRFCAPPAAITPLGRDTLVCDGGEFKFNVKYNDNGTAFVTDITNPNEELAYRIEYKQKYTDTWATYTGTGATGTIKWTELRDNGVGKTFTSVVAADAGYYRVVIAGIGGLDALQCRVISDFVNLMVKSKPVAPDVRVQLCPDPTPLKVLNLSSYLHPTDTTSNWKVNWKNVSPIPYTPAVDPTTGNVSLAFASGTHTYHYKLENKCGADSARFYVTTLKGSTIQMPPQRVVVCKDMAHSLHIQQMMGVEARGTITTPALTAAQIKLHLTTISSLPFKGAVLFNGFTAWDDPSTEKITYNNKPATRVVFTYTAADDSCLTQKVYTLEVIITENILN